MSLIVDAFSVNYKHKWMVTIPLLTHSHYWSMCNCFSFLSGFLKFVVFYVLINSSLIPKSWTLTVTRILPYILTGFPHIWTELQLEFQVNLFLDFNLICSLVSLDDEKCDGRQCQHPVSITVYVHKSLNNATYTPRPYGIA